MENSGYVYALLSVSLEGLVEVGRTSSDPKDRASQLSEATGVPTPFVVGYQRFFMNCVEAESFVHTWLETRGYRLAENREFFRAPLHIVVEAILSAPGVAEPAASLELSFAASGQVDDFLDSLFVKDVPAWQVVLDDADAAYFGRGEALQDHAEALKLYKQAAKLGSIEAMWRLGTMHRDGEACVPDRVAALEYFKESAKRGYVQSYAEMAELFADEKHRENALKCWDRFFAQAREEHVASDAFRYVRACRRNEWPISHAAALRKNL